MKLNSLVVGLVLVGLGGLAWMGQRGQQKDGLPEGDLRNPTLNLPQWQVVKVTDGDTLKVQRDGEELTIRFCGIDAPEKAQALGPESTAKLRALVDESGGWVMVDAIASQAFVEIETDRYGRTVAEVWSDEVGLINSAMVGAGMAYVYERYLDGCVSAGAIRSSGEMAREMRLGVWGRADLEKPWDWRKAKG